MGNTGDMQTEVGAEGTAEAPAMDFSPINERFDKLESSIESMVQAATPQQEGPYDGYDDYYDDEPGNGAAAGYDPFGDGSQGQQGQRPAQGDEPQYGADGQQVFTAQQVQQMIAQQVQQSVGPTQQAVQHLAFRTNLADLASEFPELGGENPEAIKGFTERWQHDAQELGLPEAVARSYQFMRQVQLARAGEQLLSQGAGAKQGGGDVIEGAGGPGGTAAQSDTDIANEIVNAQRPAGGIFG